MNTLLANPVKTSKTYKTSKASKTSKAYKTSKTHKTSKTYKTSSIQNYQYSAASSLCGFTTLFFHFQC